MNTIRLSYFFVAVVFSCVLTCISHRLPAASAASTTATVRIDKPTDCSMSAGAAPERPVLFRESAVKKVFFHKVSVSPSGRFSIISTNTMINMDLSRWAEGVASKLEESTGLDVLTGINRKLRIVVRDEETHSPPGVDFLYSAINGKLVLTMVIRNYDSVSIRRCRLILCKMLLVNWIAERKVRASAREIAAFLNNHDPPQWFTTGLWLDIDHSIHGRINDSAMGKWENGKVPIVTSLLKTFSREVDKDNRDVVWAFFSWLKTIGKKKVVFDRILGRIASGREITSQWLAGLAEQGSVEDLELDWDSFFLERRRMVLTPGMPSLGALRQLEGQLLLYRGNSGIPLDGEIKEKNGLASLIEKKGVPWLDEFVRSKTVSLRLTAMGRGKDFREVVESYCLFLEKLQKDEDDKKLILLLQEANRKLEKLRSSLLQNEHGGKR